MGRGAGDVVGDSHADGDPVWRALSDPTRRRILDLLRHRPRITGEIASHFRVSRIAVMRHLEVLSAAGLVTSRKHGRERWHYLNAVPLQTMYERWVDARAGIWASGLLRFGRQFEPGRGRVSANRPALDVALDVSIAAPRGEVFGAMTRDPGGWWGHPYLHPDATGLTLEPRLGGLLIEHWKNGGAVLATITRWSDDRQLQLAGPFHLGVALCVATFDLSPEGDGTRLQFSFRAIGAVEPEFAEKFAAGWTELVGQRLKALVETGARLGIAPDPPN